MKLSDTLLNRNRNRCLGILVEQYVPGGGGNPTMCTPLCGSARKILAECEGVLHDDICGVPG